LPTQARMREISRRTLGEELCAWIRLKPGATATEEEIRAFCRGQITHFNIPRYVRFVDDYPTTVSGKIQKFVMRDMMTAELRCLTNSLRLASLYGLVGVLLAVDEAFELNVLGLNIGVDAAAPALKLPAIGRLGLDR
jgi:AMP-binding enzyme C-terminal domain